MNKKRPKPAQNLGGLEYSAKDRIRDIYAKTLRRNALKRQNVLKNILNVHSYRQKKYKGYTEI